MEMVFFDFSKVSPMTALCFNEQCGRKQECMRYMVGQQIPKDHERGLSIYPNALHEGSCKHFREFRVIEAAYGFGDIFANVATKHAPEMRRKMEHYLGGHGTYYRYKNGERPLSPEQQEWIRSLFESYGYDRNVEFCNYKQEVDLE